LQELTGRTENAYSYHLTLNNFVKLP